MENITRKLGIVDQHPARLEHSESIDRGLPDREDRLECIVDGPRIGCELHDRLAARLDQCRLKIANRVVRMIVHVQHSESNQRRPQATM